MNLCNAPVNNTFYKSIYDRLNSLYFYLVRCNICGCYRVFGATYKVHTKEFEILSGHHVHIIKIRFTTLLIPSFDIAKLSMQRSFPLSDLKLVSGEIFRYNKEGMV